MATTSQPAGNPIYAGNGLAVNLLKTELGLRMVFNFDRAEAKGTIILEESGYGLYVLCPDVHPELPVALLDLYSPRPKRKTFQAARRCKSSSSARRRRKTHLVMRSAFPMGHACALSLASRN